MGDFRLSNLLVTIGLLAALLGAENSARADFDDSSPEMQRFSVVERCSQVLTGPALATCLEHAKDVIPTSSSLSHMVGTAAAAGLENNLKYADAVFKDLLREKTLSFQIQHLALRDSLDLDNNGDGWSTVERSNAGALGNGMINVPSQCTSAYPKVEEIRAAATKSLYFTFDKNAVKERNEKAFKGFRNLVIGGDQSGDPRCAGEPACWSLGKRAKYAKENYEKLAQHERNPDNAPNDNSLGDFVTKKFLPSSWLRSSWQKGEMSEANSAIADILQADPALNEEIEAEPGECSKPAHKKSGDPYRKCYTAFEYIGGLQANFEKYNTNPSAAEIAEHEKYLGELYQQANRKMKSKIIDSIRYACDSKFDPTDMLLSPQVAKAVLADNPGFESTYCRLLQAKLKSRRNDERLQTTLAVVGWTAVGGGLVASVFTGGALAPAVLSAGAGGSFATNYWLKASQAHQDMISATVQTGGGVGDPRDVEYFKEAEARYREQFKSEIITTVATLGIDMAISQIRYLRAAGKIGRTEEDLLEASARRAYVAEQAKNSKYAKAAAAVDLDASASLHLGPNYKSVMVTRNGRQVSLFEVMKDAAEKKYGIKVVEGEEAVRVLGENGAFGKYRLVKGSKDPVIFIRPDAPIETFMHEMRHAMQMRAKTSSALKLTKEGLPDLFEKIGARSDELIAGVKHPVVKDLAEMDVELWQYTAFKNGNATEILVDGVKTKRISDAAVVATREQMARRAVGMRQTSLALDHELARIEATATSNTLAQAKKIEGWRAGVRAAPTDVTRNVMKKKVESELAKSPEAAQYLRIKAEKEAYDLLLEKSTRLAAKDADYAASVATWENKAAPATTATAADPLFGITKEEVDVMLENLGTE